MTQWGMWLKQRWKDLKQKLGLFRFSSLPKKKNGKKKQSTSRTIIAPKAFVSQHWMTLRKYIETHIRTSLSSSSHTTQTKAAERLQNFLTHQTKDPASLMLKIIASFVIIFFLWAGLFHIDESVKGVGQIIPSKRLQVINNLEGGIVDAIFVQEGQVVKQGQPLLQLDPTANKARLEEINKDFYRFQLTIDRLKAQISGTKFEPSEKILKTLPEATQQEKDLYTASEEKYHKDQTIAQQELESKKYDYQQAETKLKYAKEKLPVLEEQYNITMKLFEKGLYSKLRTLDAKRQVVECKGDISSLSEQLQGLQADIHQAEAKLLRIKSEYETQNQKDLKEAELKLAEAQSNKSIYEDRLKRQTITAPIDGIVKELHVKTIGGAIKPADDIVTVVPLNDELLAEVKITPDDIGFVHPGLSAVIKVTAYDFTIYGRLNGTVQTISADALQDKQEKSYFKVTIHANNNFLEKYGKKFYLTPGMQVDVDIHTGKRTVLSFLLKPLIRGLNESFTER